MEPEKELKPGDKIMVYWGRFGKIEATVYKIGKEGQIYARRWRRGYHNFTQPRRVFKDGGDPESNVYDIVSYYPPQTKVEAVAP